MITRKWLIELIGATHYGNNSVGENFQKGFIAKIADHLIANGVEIPVRCKDCKHREDGMCALEEGYEYPWHCTNDDDYCSYGERRTE